MKKRILITGGSGFIGRHLTAALNENDQFELHYLARSAGNAVQNSRIVDWQNETALQAILTEIRPHYLVHLAACAEPGRDLNGFTRQIFDTLLPTIQLARLVPVDSLEMAFFFGSCEEYGDASAPFSETTLPKVISPYGWGKISSKSAIDWVCRARKLSYCWLRPFLTFGEHQSGPKFIPTVIRACLNNREVCMTAGEQTRDFMYAKDLVRMFLRILCDPQPANGLTLNLCSGAPRTIRSVAEQIHVLIGKGKLRFGAFPYRENEAMSFYGDPAIYNGIYGEFNHTPFEQALRATISSMV